MILVSKKIVPLVIGLLLLFTQTKASDLDKFALPERFKSSLEPNIDDLGNMKSKKHSSILDFGISRPDFKPPEILSKEVAKAALGDYSLSQYNRYFGRPRLVEAVAKFYSKLMNRTIDPYNEVVITVGATQALFTTFQTHTTPGDEWILIEPAYSFFRIMISAAFGVIKYVTLKPDKNCTGHPSSCDLTFDRHELASLFNNKTKGIVLNTPHNPTGKVFTLDELKFIADLAKKWNTLVVSDEVYEFLVYDEHKHIRIASLPGMYERTITICSGGKSFFATGLRVGWAYGGSEIMGNLRAMQKNIVVHPSTLAQEGFAATLEYEYHHYGTPMSYLYRIRKLAERKRTYFFKSLTDFGMTPRVPQGGFFIMANWTTITDKLDLNDEFELEGTERDFKFAKWLVENLGVLAFPVSEYFVENNPEAQEDNLRFSFVKPADQLEEADKRFRMWKNQIIS